MAEEAIEKAAETVTQYLNIGQLLDIAKKAPSIDCHSKAYQHVTPKTVTVGIIRDSAFQFYYPENIDALRRAGAEIVEFSALTDDLPPALDALYIGGGFPETHAAQLSGNEKLRHSIRAAAEKGLPVYAECGGLMYLGDELIWEDKRYPMTGILPIIIGVGKKPRGHGYTLIEVESPNPFFSPGQVLHGHEFHYSYVLDMKEKPGVSFAFRVKKGQGALNKMDGFCYKNILATYTHLHAFGTGTWVEGLVNIALFYKRKKLIDK